MKSNQVENVKIDSCLALVDKAIEIDGSYFNAYYAKSKFLTWKKDIKESIKNNAKMIELRPQQPLWKIWLYHCRDIRVWNICRWCRSITYRR